jgi:signal transduction histidine kinase
MSKRSDEEDRVPAPRRRYQYGLGTLFLLTLVVSVACSVGAELARARGGRVFEYVLMIAIAPLLLLMVMGLLVHLRDGRRRDEKR